MAKLSIFTCFLRLYTAHEVQAKFAKHAAGNCSDSLKQSKLETEKLQIDFFSTVKCQTGDNEKQMLHKINFSLH
jgi:hypothetical protein